MQIHIGNYTPASFLLEKEPHQWHALVVIDSGRQPTNFVDLHARSHLYLWFDDVEEPRAGKEVPTKSMVERAMNFAKGKDKLLVACRAGQGRSVALAYLIACREHGVEEALKLLDATRHRPNRLVVTLGEDFLEDFDALNPFDEWRRRYAHIRLSDYYDEIEKELDELESQGASNRICPP